jgi:hypothetical protein
VSGGNGLDQEKDMYVRELCCGKTSLVQRYVENIFSEKYQTTIGVKISKKTIALEGRMLN